MQEASHIPTDLDACQSLIEQQARALDQLLAGSTDYESLRADVWKQSHPEAVRTYRSDERRDTADRNRLTRAQRRLANAKKLEAARLAAKTTEAEQQKSRFIDKLSARRKFLSGQGFTGIGHLRSGGRCTRQLTGGVEVVVERIQDRASRHPFLLCTAMQVVVCEVCHPSVAVCLAGQVSGCIVTE